MSAQSNTSNKPFKWAVLEELQQSKFSTSISNLLNKNTFYLLNTSNSSIIVELLKKLLYLKKYFPKL